MNDGLSTVSYIGATILFILSLGGLSNPETSCRGNLYGIIGMALGGGHSVRLESYRCWNPVHHRGNGSRRIRGRVRRPHRVNDANARTGRADAQFGGAAAALVGFASYL